MRPREYLILITAVLVAIAILLGSKTTYSRETVRIGIATLFSVIFYIRARFPWAKWLAIAILWTGVLLSFFT